MNNQYINESLNWRYATKKYDLTKKISETDWETLKDSLRLAPSSYGLQPWKFLVVQNLELRKKLREVSWGQSIIEECSHLVVFTTLREMTSEHIQAHIAQTASVRHLEPAALENYKKFMEQKILVEKDKSTHLGWNQRQAYIAMGFLLETAALLRIDSTPIEGLDPDKYDEILNLKNTPYKAVAAVSLGYRHADDTYQKMSKSRFEESKIIQQID